jgi:NADP-dependent 3-hydroxy acid dehydrogenase YdfG
MTTSRLGLFSQVLVIGSSSGIAQYVLPELDLKNLKVVELTRSKLEIPPFKCRMRILVKSDISYMSPSAQRELISNFDSQLPILVINFAGYFGNPVDYANFDSDDVIEIASINLRIHLSVMRMAGILPKGIGGANFEKRSLGYVAGKSSIAFLNEIADQENAKFGVRLGLIAPGAFPTRMRNEATNKEEIGYIESKSLSPELVGRLHKLVNLINWLAHFPNEAGGRIWSANYDSLESPASKDFGRLRRII